MPVIIGTAGHIDHGKTALIRALTGQDTDRLKEERERGISIDLGFAYLERPDGSRAGIVDVPGHERFIRNMLAGAHGIDLVLLVVAADDGVMPQTEEHFEILHLLGVTRGIAVISKADLATVERIEEVRDEIAVLLAGTALEGMPAIAVSALTGVGLDSLRAEIERQLAAMERPVPPGCFRLPVDRAFVMKGHGVVVTGTAVSGSIRAGDAARLLPGGEECRVRSIQVHGSEVHEAGAGKRVALNLGGVEKTDVVRGHMLVAPRLTRTTRRFDARVEIRPYAKRPVKNHARVRVYLGTAEVAGKLVLLDERAALAPKERGFSQVVLEEPVAAVCGDRFILRDETAQRTLGGGEVLQPFAAKHRRRDHAVPELERLSKARSPEEVVAALVHLSPDVAVPVDWLCEAMNRSGEEVIDCARAAGLVLLPDAQAAEAVATAEAVEQIERAVIEQIAELHRESPLLPGIEMEALRSGAAPALSPKLFRAVVGGLERREAVVRVDSLLHLPSHEVALSRVDRDLGTRAERRIAAADLKPPDLKQLEAELQAPRKRLLAILSQLEREGRLARVGPEIYFAREPLERARRMLEEYLRQHGEITAATFRDLIDASRKFSIALLDYFDRTGFTLRVGDLRKLRR